MNESGINKLNWGFIFIMLSIRIQGFDILPDIVGYLFFASGFKSLAFNSIYFSKASKYNIPIIILSLFSIYQTPAQIPGIHLGPLGIIGLLIGIAYFILNLIVIYNLFMAIKDMAEQRYQFNLGTQSNDLWNQYKFFQIATLFIFPLIFIPPLVIIYIIVLFIICIVLTVKITSFLEKCNETLTL